MSEDYIKYNICTLHNDKTTFNDNLVNYNITLASLGILIKYIALYIEILI